MSEELQPWLSIITVCYNDSHNLQRTLSSIREQACELIQSIIIDGGSIDETSKIIQANLDIISDCVSEKDHGLYDAMNKGIQLAKGEYILFLNAGDIFHDAKVVYHVKQQCNGEDVLYGKSIVVNEDGSLKGNYHKITPLSLTWENFKYGMVVNHQALFVKLTIAAKYDLKYQISADIDWAIRTLKNANSAKYLNLIVADFQTGGISTRRRKKALLERWSILKKHFGLKQAILSHIAIIISRLSKMMRIQTK